MWPGRIRPFKRALILSGGWLKMPAASPIALSTSLGNSNHVAVANVVRHAGADTRAPKLRVFDTALDAVADVVAGHADIGAITAASAVPELEAGVLRAIAISSPARLSGPYASTPTWDEQGADCVIGSWRGVSGRARAQRCAGRVLGGNARGRHPDRRMAGRPRPAFLDRDVSRRRRRCGNFSRASAPIRASILGGLGLLSG